MTASSPGPRVSYRDRRHRNRLIRSALVVGIIVVCLSAAGIWRLTLGPVAVPFLSAYLAGQLDHADLPVEARWDAAAVHWPFMAPWLYVRFSDFRASDVLTADGIGIRVPLRDLVRGQPSVAGVVLYAPTVVLKQGEGDGFNLGDGAAQSGAESPLAALASGTMVEVLDGTISLELQRSPATIQVVDIQASVTEVDGQVVFGGTGSASLPAHPAVPLELAARLLPEQGEISAELTFRGIEPKAVAELIGLSAPQAMLEVPLSGSVAVNGPLEAAVLRLTATGAGGHVQVPDARTDAGRAAVPINSMEVRLEYAVESRTLDLTELAVTGPAGDLRFKGSFRDPPAGPSEFHADFAGSLSIDDLAAWLGPALDPSTESWVRRRIDGGSLTNLTLTADFPDGIAAGSRVDISGVVRETAIHWEEGEPTLDLAVVDVDLAGPELTVIAPTATVGAATLDDLRLQSADLFSESGAAELTARLSGDSGSLLQQIGLDRGAAAKPMLRGPLRDAELRVRIPFASDREAEVTLRGEFQDIRVDPKSFPAGYSEFDLYGLAGTWAYDSDGIDVQFAGKLGESILIDDAVLTASGPEASSIRIAATLHGSLADLIGLGVKVQGAGRLPSGIDTLAGTARIRVVMDVPLQGGGGPGIRRLEGVFAAPLFTAGGFGSGPWEGSEFRDVTGAVALQGEALTVFGTAALADSELSFAWRSPLPDVPGDHELTVRGLLWPEARNALGIQFADIDGPLDLAGSGLRRQESGSWEVHIEAGLSAPTVTIPALEWTKPAHVPLHARVRGLLAEGEPLRLQLVGGGTDVDGRVWFADGTLDRAVFARLRIGEHRLTGAVVQGTDGYLSAVLHGDQVDVRPFLSADSETLARPEPLRLHVDTRSARTMAPALAGPLEFTMEADGQGVQDLYLTLGLPDEERMELRGVGTEGALELELTSTNARTMADAFGLGVAANDGAVRIEAIRKEGRITGTVQVGEFNMVDAPVFLQLLQTVTVLGLLEQIAGGGGVAFSSFDADFTFSDGVIDIRNGIAQGLTLGVTVEGTIDTRNRLLDLRGALIPAYAVNLLLTRVPVIDQLITGTDSKGVLAADYAVTGPAAEPEIAASPLQFLMPGVLRNVLQGLGGTLAPPPSPDE